MFKYAPPANIDDLAGRPSRAAFLEDWHKRIQDAFDDEISNLPSGNKLFFSETASAAESADIAVTWNAFPLVIKREQPADVARWDAADRLARVNRAPAGAPALNMPCRRQDEYCEWFAYRASPGGPISRIVFTAEAPEYWIDLARHDFDCVVELYRRHVSTQVQPDDLKLTQDIAFGNEMLPKGSYNPYNPWNTTKGVMHLTHPANTLGAEIDLAARATIPRHDVSGKRITEVRRFACGSNFGDPNRSSDPNIGLGVNLTVLATTPDARPQSITLANPVALYIDRIAAGVLTDADDNPLQGWFKIVRGVAGRGLMAVLEPPEGAAFGLDSVQVIGRRLTHGGQVADHIQMVLYAKTAHLGAAAPTLRSCISHCCRPENVLPIDQVNLDHKDPTDGCGASAKDPFPELVGAGAAPDLVALRARPSSVKRAGRLLRVSE
uniref:hypothetical protein n=1 Tax=Bradyrhizobium sp. (strain ORS 278) TaxID=114615 RepID=UPI0006832E2A|nr:hypothetical protein [Bradyrhizobium sp. ORS 278]